MFDLKGGRFVTVELCVGAHAVRYYIIKKRGCQYMRSGKHLPIGRIRQFKNFFQKGVDKRNGLCYNGRVVKIRPIGQAVKTLASHAGNSGSIPGWVTKNRKGTASQCLFVFDDSHDESEPRHGAPRRGKVCAGSQRKQMYKGAHGGSDSRMDVPLPRNFRRPLRHADGVPPLPRGEAMRRISKKTDVHRRTRGEQIPG